MATDGTAVTGPATVAARAGAGAGAGAGSGAGPSVDPVLAAKIKKQTEFYFSAHNLPRDRFLKENMDAEGWVTLDIMLKFNRLKALSDSKAVIAAALGDSTVLVVSDDKSKIKRREALPDTVDFSTNVIYAKGFPDNAELEEVEAAFESFGKVGRVDMRRIRSTQTFKGSVFVTFATKEAAAKAIEGPVTFLGKPLEKVMWRNEYVAMKKAERAAAKGRGGRGDRDGDGGDEPTFTGVTRVVNALLRIDMDMADVSQHEMRNTIASFGDVKFFEVDANGATARFGAENGASEALAKLNETKATFSGAAPKAMRVLEGDEATAYWDKVESFHRKKWSEMQRKRRSKHRGSKRGRNGGGWGGSQGPSKAARVTE